MWLSPPPISPLFPYTTLFRSPIRRGIIFLAAIRPHRVGDGTHCPRAVDPLRFPSGAGLGRRARDRAVADRKSTRLNSSHLVISYAVFCLKKKKSSGTQSPPVQ